MKIESIKVERFGRLLDVDSGPAALPELVVVLGPNEAGKSTLFQFLTTILYGFHPATREGNPYAPWSGGDAAGSICLRLDDGACADVERRLLASPTGRLVMDGATEDLRNRPVPWAEHVPRAVFRQVFAVTLAELTGLDDETWARVQDRIVASMGSTDLMPARHVAADLEQEAGELWRPNRRGNQRIREIQDQILALRTRRREALGRDGELRSLVGELEAVRARLRDARLERHQERLAIERVQALVPIRTQLRRIDALRGDAGPEEELENLPAEPAIALEEAAANVSGIEERLRVLAQEMDEPREVMTALGTVESRLLEHADEVGDFLTRCAALAADRARLRAIEEEIQGLERRIEGTSEQIMVAPWSEAHAAALESIAIEDLRDRLDRFSMAREGRRVLEAARDQHEGRAPGRDSGPSTHRTAPSMPLWPGIALLAVGGSLLGWGFWRGMIAATTVGSAIAAVGLVLLVLSARRARARASEPTQADAASELDERVLVARTAEGAALTRLTEVVGDLPVLPSLLEEPTPAFGTGVERLKELLDDVAARKREAVGLRTRLTELDAAARRLAKMLDLEVEGGAEVLAHKLEREHRRAERLREADTGARRELRRLEREQERLEGEAAAARASHEALRKRLEEAGDGDVPAGGRELRDRMEARDRARRLMEELERAHPDLDDIRHRIADAEAAGESWTVDDDDVARRRARHEELVVEAEELTRRAEALDKDIARLRAMETVDAVDGEAASLVEEESALTLRRDRLRVLAHLVSEADRSFREEHQPDLIRRAGTYLGHLTGNRYDRLVADESGDGDVFYILGPDLPGPVALKAPVSTGTLEQAYLALRLAIVDHLDHGTERLPLFVDEVFVNWDGQRRSRGIDLLADIARARQLFVFTCHPEVAGELAERGAAVVELP